MGCVDRTFLPVAQSGLLTTEERESSGQLIWGKINFCNSKDVFMFSSVISPF